MMKMQIIILAVAILSGVVIGYVNGRKNADEDWQLCLRELEEELLKDVDAGASGKKTEHSPIWHHGALWAINQMQKKGNR